MSDSQWRYVCKTSDLKQFITWMTNHVVDKLCHNTPFYADNKMCSKMIFFNVLCMFGIYICIYMLKTRAILNFRWTTCVCAWQWVRDVYMYKRPVAFIVSKILQCLLVGILKKPFLKNIYILYICLKSYTFLLTSI